MRGEGRILRGTAALAAALVLTSAPAAATHVVELTLDEAVGEADRVIHARVARAETSWGTHLGEAAIVTRYVFADEEALLGAPLGELTAFGGRVGDHAMRLEGQPELAPGDEVFLLVLDDEVLCPFVGVWKGVYTVRDGRVFRGDRAVVDVVGGEVELARDGERGMPAAAFAAELERAIARRQAGLAARGLSAPKPQAGDRVASAPPVAPAATGGLPVLRLPERAAPAEPEPTAPGAGEVVR